MSESAMTTSESGNRIWKNKAGAYHREDGPAVEYADGTKLWYQNDKLHRVDGPAVEYKDGSTAWHYKNCFLGFDLKGFWKLWKHLDEEQRQNVNLHMWLIKLCSV